MTIEQEIFMLKGEISDVSEKLTELEEKLNPTTYKIGDRFKESLKGDVYLLACCDSKRVILVNVITGCKASHRDSVAVSNVHAITKSEFDSIAGPHWSFSKV